MDARSKLASPQPPDYGEAHHATEPRASDIIEHRSVKPLIRSASKGLSELPLLSGIDDRVRRRILAVSERRKMSARAHVFGEGTDAEHLHIVMSGTVELFGTAAGKEAIIGLVKPGESFILAAVVKNAKTLMSARTNETSEILYIPADTFRWAMHNDPILAVKVSLELGSGFRAMVKQLRDHKLRTSKQRLAAYLVRLARGEKRKGAIELPLNKRVLSSLLGMEPESLSRAFVELRPLGVEMHRQHVRIRDLSLIEELASCDWAVDDPQG